ncbi:MAG: branched-chain amino acid ABC transporter substrate-binding protein [Pseudomonadota bacterium]|mgnify:CR=1 FL=1
MPLIRLVTLFGLAGLMLAGCGQKDAPRTAAGELIIRIGSVAPLTGPQSHLGKDNDNGARMAIDEINARGVTLGGKRVHFEIMSEDDQADPRNATIVAQKLVDARVRAVLGHLNSGTSIPASKIYHDHGIVQISPSATAVAYTDQGYKTAFRVMTNDRQQGRVLGEYAVKRMGKRVAIIDDRTAYGQGLADEVVKAVEASGGTVVKREYTNDRSTDFLAILTTIKARNPDVVFYGGMDGQGGPMARQMQQLGIKAKFLSGDGTQTTEFLKLAGPAAEGVTASSPGLPLTKMPGGSEFQKKFTARHGHIQNYAPYAYDAAHALVAAMIKADSADPAKYLPALKALEMRGVTGMVAFDDRGDIRGGAITLYRVRHGKWEVLETVSSAGAPAGQKR